MMRFVLALIVALAALVCSADAMAVKKATAFNTAVSAYRNKYSKSKPGTFYYREEAQLKKTFAEMAKLYGEENAVKMVKDEPACIIWNPQNFKPSLDAFSEIFGEEEAKAMVMRNPNLLSVPRPGSGPGSADKADDKTMQLSYVVAWTRPVGAQLLTTLALLLSIPVIEGATGVPREQWLSLLQQ
mmetsp:Transcript_3297/g.8318  ORF Transcript_3297/g.8318 Transcript_3297/m.8318 type:complete len:185 (+) Transcript_3297:3-557(+)